MSPKSTKATVSTISRRYGSVSARRRKGWDLYGILGIGKGSARRRGISRSELQFRAPVGMIFTIDHDMGWMSWLDYGMFIQNICIARGAKGSIHVRKPPGSYHDVVEKHLGLPEIQLVHAA